MHPSASPARLRILRIATPLALAFLPGCYGVMLQAMGGQDNPDPRVAALDAKDREAHARDPRCVENVMDSAAEEFKHWFPNRNGAFETVFIGDIEGDGIEDRAVKLDDPDLCHAKSGTCQYFVFRSNGGCTQYLGMTRAAKFQPVAREGGNARYLYAYNFERTLSKDSSQYVYSCEVAWWKQEEKSWRQQNPYPCSCEGDRLQKRESGPDDAAVCEPFREELRLKTFPL